MNGASTCPETVHRRGTATRKRWHRQCIYAIGLMDLKLEHRMGVEPMNTGFADQRVSHFATGAHVGEARPASQGVSSVYYFASHLGGEHCCDRGATATPGTRKAVR